MGQQQSQTKKADTSEIDIFESEIQSQSNKQKISQSIRNSQRSRQEQYHTEILSSNIKSDNHSLIDIPSDFCTLQKVQLQKNIQQQVYTLQGILLKQQTGIFGQESERYCFLTSNKFIYNENNKVGSPRAGILNFNLMSCSLNVLGNSNQINNFTIKITGSNKQFIFSALNKKENKKWTDALFHVIEGSSGKKYNLTYLSHYHRFWRKDYFSQKQFREQAETGDIVLMRGTSQSAAMQRALTQEQFDHVALVIKNIKDQILLFQANGAVGVGIMPWNRFISKGYYNQQEIVTYRKLKINRTKQFYDAIQQFVCKNMGRKYKFSIKKLILNRESTSQGEKKTYFCSSLVAKVYKILGLLDSYVSSTQYMPHNFTQKQQLQLKQNGRFGPASLGKQHIIVFEKRFFQQN